METSAFTRQLVANLRQQFTDPLTTSGVNVLRACELLGLTEEQKKLVQADRVTSKKEALSMSMMMSKSSQAGGSYTSDTEDISDEFYLFSHIVDCVKALKEVVSCRAKTTDSAEGNDSSFLYSGFVSHVEKIVKDVALPTSRVFADCSTSPLNESFHRCLVTLHSLSSFPSLCRPDKEQTSKKLPLLHHVAFNSQSLDILKAIYNTNKECVQIRDKTGALPLHWAILNKKAPEIAEYLLSMYPEAASVPDNAGYLPLHWAVNNDDVNMSIIKSLLKTYPAAASTPASKNKTLPLHWCVNRSEPNLALVKELITAYPEAISTPCDHGWLPLHYSVNRAKVSLTILRLLLDKYPAGVSHRNSDGQMPIHRLLDRYEPNRKAVKWLIEAEPATLKACDSEGYLPLHVALDGSKPPSWRLIKLLLEKAPQTVETTTLDGFLPLHVVMKMQDRFGDPASVASSGVNNQHEHDNKDNTSADGQSALEKEAAMKLNQNRFLSIVQELVSLYPDAVHMPAIDIVPVKDGVDPDTWEGQWKKSRWTPYSRAMAKGKHTPIAKLLRPHKKRPDSDGVEKKGLNRSFSSKNPLTPGTSSSKLETAPVVTPSGHRGPSVEVQLHSKLHNKSTAESRTPVKNEQKSPPKKLTNTMTPMSPTASNDINSSNYGNMGDTHLPPLTKSPRVEPPDMSKSPRSNRKGSVSKDTGDGLGYTHSSEQTVSCSENKELFSNLNNLLGSEKKEVLETANEQSFWAAKKINVTEGSTTFTIDNDAYSTKNWKWQW